MMKQYFFSETPVKYFSRPQIDAVKGILILSVILGHLRPLVGENFPIFQFVYNYHVMGFLLLPFLYPIKSITLLQIKTWATRFFVPFTFFFILYGVLNFFILGHSFGIFDVLKGYFIATPIMVDAVTGSEILWFLPHIFIVLIVFNFTMTKAKNLWVLLGVAFVGHVCVGFISKDIASVVPFTAINIFYLFFVGYVMRIAVLALKNQGHKYVWLFCIVFLGFQAVSILTSSVLGYTGFYFFDGMSPIKLFICDLVVISGLLFFLYTSIFERIKILTWLGQHSIIIFLVHQPFLFLCWKSLEYFLGSAETTSAMVLCGALSFMVSLIGSAVCVLFFTHFNKLNILVFPRSFENWRTVFAKGDA